MEFLACVGELIPCEVCRKNFARHLARLPVDEFLGSRDDLFAWSYRLHDMTNRETTETREHFTARVEKPSPEFGDVREFYYARVEDNCKECEVD